MKLFSYEDTLNELIAGTTTVFSVRACRWQAEQAFAKTGKAYYQARAEYLQRALSTYKLIKDAEKAKK